MHIVIIRSERFIGLANSPVPIYTYSAIHVHTLTHTGAQPKISSKLESSRKQSLSSSERAGERSSLKALELYGLSRRACLLALPPVGGGGASMNSDKCRCSSPRSLCATLHLLFPGNKCPSFGTRARLHTESERG